MLHPTFDADAASILFNLPGYRVLSATDATEERPRAVLVESTDQAGACPDCGVISARVHPRPVQQVEDISCGGESLTVLVRKRRYVCLEVACSRQLVQARRSQDRPTPVSRSASVICAWRLRALCCPWKSF